MKKSLFLVFVIILIISAGCTVESTEEIDKMKNTIEELEQQVLDQDLRIDKLQEIISDQVLKIYMLEESNSNIAALDPTGNSGYSMSGDFLVSISNVEGYLDGCKVYLRIGNPNNAIYSGFTIRAGYGRRADFSDKNFNYGVWRESLKEKEIQITTELNSGAWNNAEIILPSINVKDFSYLEIEIITDSIKLLTN